MAENPERVFAHGGGPSCIRPISPRMSNFTARHCVALTFVRLPFLGMNPIRYAIPVACLTSWLGAQTPSAVPRATNVLRTQLCASCHGLRWEGGRAPSMLDDVWAHDGTESALERSIREGWPENGMPAFGGQLGAEEIHALAVDIRESNRRGQTDAGPTLSRRSSVRKSERHSFQIQAVADGLEVPWGLAFLPDGRILVSERPGRLQIIEYGRSKMETISGLPPIWERQDGGLLDVAVHPDFAHNGWIYLAFSEPGGTGFGTSSTRIIRGKLEGTALVDHQTLFQAAPALYWRSNIHYGSRFLFGHDGMLYYSLGDRGRRTEAQNLASPYGKVHRIFDDGRVPPDNPFVENKEAVKSIWSYGHRNPQGLTQNPITREIWEVEHGPRGGDELNLIQRGKNYGWPVISEGILEDGEPPESGRAHPGMEQPVAHWEPPFAPGAVLYYSSEAFPGWKGNLFVTALAGQQLRRLELDGRNVVHEEVLFQDLGRVRDVVVGPDGFIYLALNSWGRAGRVIRLVPTER